LVSRTGRDHAKRFQDLAAAVAKLAPRTLILDAEVCVVRQELVSQFHLLGDLADELTTPPLLMAFDCLYIKGRDLRGRPLHERRAILERPRMIFA
jgi:bifunctional non-homologous end joining protein LigD